METVANEKRSETTNSPAAAGLRGVLVFCPETRKKTSEYFSSLNRCPRTSTIVGKSTYTNQMRFIPVRCKCWNCPHCCKVNARQLEERLRAGQPSALLTLTTCVRDGETPQECHDRVRPQITKLFRELRKKYGVIEYACILEEFKSGYPHWHCLLKCAWIPQHEISKIWLRLTGAYRVEIEKIRHQRSMGKYLVKYVTKENLKPRESRLGRIVSFSKNYLSLTRVTPTNDEWRWFKDKAPIENVLASYEGFLKAIEIMPDGSVMATTEVNETLPSPDEAMAAFLGYEGLYIEDDPPDEGPYVIAEMPF